MRIKRSHLEALHFVTGTLLTCALVVSVSLNLQAHPLVKMLEATPAKAATNSSKSESKSACDQKPELRTMAIDELDGRPKHRGPVEPEIASLLKGFDPQASLLQDIHTSRVSGQEDSNAMMSESIEEAMNDACATEKAAEKANELNKDSQKNPNSKDDDSEIKALLNEIESALNPPAPSPVACEDAGGTFDAPAVLWTLNFV